MNSSGPIFTCCLAGSLGFLNGGPAGCATYLAWTAGVSLGLWVLVAVAAASK